MRWNVSHLIDAPADAVLAAALDAETLRGVPSFMPLIAAATRVEQRDLGDGRVLVVDRFEPAFDPPPFARGLTREMLGWDLRFTWDLAARAARFVIDPHVKDEWKRYADVQGEYRIVARGEGCERALSGDLQIRVPVLGALAERFAVHTLSSQFAGEARLLGARAKGRSSATVTG